MVFIMFWVFVGKELKSIARDPKIIIAMFIVPLIIIIIFYAIIGYGLQQQITQAIKEGGSVALINLDNDLYSYRFISFLRDIGVEIKLLDPILSTNITKALEVANTKILYVIPKGFSENITRFSPTSIKIYIRLGSLTIGESSIVDLATRLVERFNDNITATIALEKGIPAEFIRGAITKESYAFIYNKVVSNPYILTTFLTLSGFFIPLIVLMLIMMASQLIVTSIAVEKEEKMFETLLSLPINRMSIIGAKLLVSILISIIYMSIYGLALFSYIFQVIGIGIDIGDIEMPYTFSLFILQRDLAITLILNSIGLAALMLMISLILGIFAEDVRTAQALIGNIIGPLVILAYMPMFIDISGMGQAYRALLSLIPIANTVFISKLAIINDIVAMYIAGLSNIAYGAILFLVIRKIVNSETIFTMKLKRFKKQRIAET
uniref:ABC transporter permease n=1 Tax=Ignisphaera aggregans TaxID=334771 RepID=A0A7C5YVV1_9CREN